MVYLDKFVKARTARIMASGKVIRGERRQHVIQKTIDLLDDWRLSPWENEAAGRTGIRSALCVLGHEWETADLEAASVVQAAFSKLGKSERPSWQEGQRGYTIGLDHCKRCHAMLTGEQVERGFRFCGASCSRLALLAPDYEHGWWNDAVGRHAYDLIRKSRTKPRDCAQCGNEFRVNAEAKENRFCSKRCRNESMKTRKMRACEHCATPFLPSQDINRFCSMRCSSAAGKRKQFERVCEVCATGFASSSRHAMYCCQACNAKAHYHRKKNAAGASRRKRGMGLIVSLRPLSARAFDSIFKMAA